MLDPGFLALFLASRSLLSVRGEAQVSDRTATGPLLLAKSNCSLKRRKNANAAFTSLFSLLCQHGLPSRTSIHLLYASFVNRKTSGFAPCDLLAGAAAPNSQLGGTYM